MQFFLNSVDDLKLKSSPDMLRSNSKTVWENHIVNPEGEKGKAAVGRIYRKGRI